MNFVSLFIQKRAGILYVNFPVSQPIVPTNYWHTSKDSDSTSKDGNNNSPTELQIFVHRYFTNFHLKLTISLTTQDDVSNIETQTFSKRFSKKILHKCYLSRPFLDLLSSISLYTFSAIKKSKGVSISIDSTSSNL